MNDLLALQHMPISTITYLLLGANIGSRQLQIQQSIDKINADIGEILSVSKYYETAAWGDENQPLFLNKVVKVETPLNAKNLLKGLQTIEKTVGREKTHKWGPRIIDIDILFYGNEIYNSNHLILPHPEIQNRRFTLVPLCEIAPNLMHPIFKKTAKMLLDECRDNLDVYIFESKVGVKG